MTKTVTAFIVVCLTVCVGQTWGFGYFWQSFPAETGLIGLPPLSAPPELGPANSQEGEKKKEGGEKKESGESKEGGEKKESGESKEVGEKKESEASGEKKESEASGEKKESGETSAEKKEPDASKESKETKEKGKKKASSSSEEIGFKKLPELFPGRKWQGFPSRPEQIVYPAKYQGTYYERYQTGFPARLNYIPYRPPMVYPGSPYLSYIAPRSAPVAVKGDPGYGLRYASIVQPPKGKTYVAPVTARIARPKGSVVDYWRVGPKGNLRYTIL